MTSRSLSMIFVCSLMTGSSAVQGQVLPSSPAQDRVHETAVEPQTAGNTQKQTIILLSEDFQALQARLKALEEQKTLQEARIYYNLKNLELDRKKEASALKTEMIYYNAGLLSVMLAVVLGSGYFSLKSATDKSEKTAENLKKDIEKLINHLTQENQKTITQAVSDYEKTFKMSTDALIIRALDRGTATVYGEMCDDFLELSINFSDEEREMNWYETLLNSFCDFAQKAYDASQKNYESIGLVERDNGKLIEYDIDSYVRNFKSYADILLLRKEAEDLKNIRVKKADLELITNRTQKKFEAMFDTNEHNSETYTRYQRRIEKLEAIKNIIQKIPKHDALRLQLEEEDYGPLPE